ncbi:MAG TPA: patatin-like phospholipase family protein [Candidatus Paceibacterota bacterium]|jgi:predicted patatin/cPLA2 family phospholipase|nr:patatin-like phospholipase family protein [Candidatus Paceibacterota bacterium]
MASGKIAFIASGGGMSCAYSAGAASALQDSGIRPNIFIGSSGSAGTVSYFACGEADRATKLWQEEVTNPRVLQKHPLRLDVDFVIDSMRDRFPFDEQRLRDANTELYLATTERASIRSRYVSNHEPLNWYDVMRASMATPFVYGRTVQLDGKLYHDGDIATSLDDSISLAQSLGASLIYVCDTRSKDSLWQNAKELGLASLITFDFIRTLVGEYRKHKVLKDKITAKVIWIKPLRKLPTSIINNNPAAIKEAIDTGYADTKKLLG